MPGIQGTRGHMHSRLCPQEAQSSKEPDSGGVGQRAPRIRVWRPGFRPWALSCLEAFSHLQIPTMSWDPASHWGTLAQELRREIWGSRHRPVGQSALGSVSACDMGGRCSPSERWLVSGGVWVAAGLGFRQKGGWPAFYECVCAFLCQPSSGVPWCMGVSPCVHMRVGTQQRVSVKSVVGL